MNASLKSAPSKLAFVNDVPVSTAFAKMAPLKSLPSNDTRSTTPLLKSAFVNFESRAYALLMTVSRKLAEVKSASDMIAPARSYPSADLPPMEHCLKSAKVSLAPFAWPMALDLKTQRVVSLKFIGGSLNLSVWPSARQARGAAVIAAPRQAAPALLRSLAGVTTGAWRSARVVDAASTTQ